MHVLLEVIPDTMTVKGQEKSVDYEAFTIRSVTEAQNVFEAEFRKLSLPEDVEILSGFLNGPLVWKDLRTAIHYDRHFSVRDVYVPCGNYGFTYRLSPYVAGKHSR